MKNDLLLRAAKGEEIERYPVWIMRQAGRILPEYRAVRASVNGFKELVKNPELCCEVTLQPVDILNVDAAIIFKKWENERRFNHKVLLVLVTGDETIIEKEYDKSLFDHFRPTSPLRDPLDGGILGPRR
jgi:hypothetical protein